MKSTDVTIIAAPFGFGPTSKALAVAKELISRGYSVKLLGDKNTLRLAKDAGILALEYKYRAELNLADLRSKVVISCLDVSTKINNTSGTPLILVDSLFWLRGWFERKYDYVADMVLSQRFFKKPLPTEVAKAQQFHEVGAILSPGFLKTLPNKEQKLVFYPGGLRSPYLGDNYGKAYFCWCKNVLIQATKQAKWDLSQLTFILPPQLDDRQITSELTKLNINYVVGCSDLSKHLLSATHAFISPGIETTLEAIASGINPLFTLAFNGSHIPQLIADRSANVGVELSPSFNARAKQFEAGTNHLSGLSMQVEEYTMSQLDDKNIFAEAVESAAHYLTSLPQVKNRFPLGKDGARDIVDYIVDCFLAKEYIPNAYYRVSVKAKIKVGNKTLLVKEDDKNWDLPGGGVEHGENIASALARELSEEIGIQNLQPTHPPQLFKMIDKSANRPLLFLVFDFDVSDDIKLQPGPNVKIKTFTPKDIPQDIVDYSKDYVDYIKK